MRFLPGPKSRKASTSRNQNQIWTSRIRPENRREHLPVVRWPQGSSPCREGQKPPPADASADVPRPAGTKRAVLGSNAQAERARARPELRGGKLCLLRSETPQKIRREGWGLSCPAAKRPAGRSAVGRGRRRGYPPAREPTLQRGEGPVARRRRSTPQPRVDQAGASCPPSSVQ